MSYLLAKYALLFLLTAVIAFLLGKWWARRKIIDVTDSYLSMTRSLDSSNRGWERLWSRLDSLDGSVSSTLASQIAAIPAPVIPKTDLAGVEAKLAELETSVNSSPTPVETDLSPLTRQIESLASSLAALPKPQPPDLSSVEDKLAAFEAALMSLPVPEPTDLNPVIDRVANIEAAINAIAMPETADFSPVTARIDELERALRAMPAPQIPPPVDLTAVTDEIQSMRLQISAIRLPETNLVPVQERIDALEAAVNALDTPRSTNVDFAPVHQRLDAMEAALRSVPTIETHAAPDLTPLNQRLSSLEGSVAALAKLLEGLCNDAPAPVATSGPRLLTSAEFGPADDLKLISGVGPKLEKLLHKNGIYYFWQIASWSDDDVEFVDAQLEVFTGRIARDDWVRQASELKSMPGAAQSPD